GRHRHGPAVGGAEQEPAAPRSPRKPGAADRRSHAVTSDPAQSVEQRLQVHEAGRGQAARQKGGRWSQLDRDRRVRYRHRHDARAAGQAVRGIHSGRFLDRTAVWRKWARAFHHAQARAHDGGRRDGDERAGQGFGLYYPPARKRGRAGEELDRFRQSPFAHCRSKPIDRERLRHVIGRFRAPARPTRVLMGEDDVIQRERMRGWLEGPQWALWEAENGREALKRIQENKPDVILLDLMMPEMDGFAVVAALQKEASWQDIPVIVITARDLDAQDRERLNSGVQSVLVKERFRPADLIERVRRLVQTKPVVGNGMEAAS